MTTLPLVIALAVLAGSGCFGLPAGSATHGDSVTVRYSALDLDTGVLLRNERTATFHLGSGDSGLGLAFERALRGHVVGDNVTFDVVDDPSLEYSETASVDRALPAIPREQTVPRSEFDATPFGPAELGKEFAAYGIYTAVVTAVNDTEVAFTVSAQPDQEDPVPSVGAVLVTTTTDTHLQRSLRPTVGATFAIQPPSPFNPSTPLGLSPGSYRVLGATDSKLEYEYAASTASDLLGKDLRFTVTVTAVTASSAGVEPVDGNYGVRDSPQVNGDAASVLGMTFAPVDEQDDHAH